MERYCNRIALKDTRAIIDAILDGSIEETETKHIPILNMTSPVALNNVSEGILDPRDTYPTPEDWEVKAKQLAKRYIENFEQYVVDEASEALKASGPQL